MTSSEIDPVILLQPSTLPRGLISPLRSLFAILGDCILKPKALEGTDSYGLTCKPLWISEQLQLLCTGIAAADDFPFLRILTAPEPLLWRVAWRLSRRAAVAGVGAVLSTHRALSALGRALRAYLMQSAV
jgi:hypothetical protein